MAHNNTPSRKIETKWLVLAAVMLGSFMGPLDASIVNTVLPAITQYFHTDVSIAQWVPTVYLLTISCLILFYGRLGDIFGYRRIFLYGLAGFTVTSLLCGLSQSIWMLIAFRALQGLSAGMIMAVGMAIITSAFPPTERGKALGIYAISIAAALGLGPTIGGAVAEHLSWRYVFIINVPIGVVALLWCYRVIPQGVTKPGQHLDWYGVLAAFVFLLSLLLYTNRGQDWGWLSPASISLLMVALISGVAFIWLERRVKQPMLNLALFRSRVFGFASLSALLNFVAIYAVVFLTPFYLTFVLHYSILKVGLVMAASPVATLFVAPAAGALSDRIGSRGLAFCGMIICAVGLFLLSGLGATSSSIDVIWRLVICGVGGGMFQSPNNSAIMGSVPVIHLGVASGMLAAMRNVGMVLGIALAGAVLYNLAPVAASGQIGPLASAEVEEFLAGVRWAFIAGAIVACIAAVTSLAAVERPGEA
ncbi:MAG TPA: MFS transporter [Dehalococcoidia bacterium]|nr:MFS transporter [Dehalococcoidia bacterium]